jgi:hypothetical protein
MRRPFFLPVISTRTGTGLNGAPPYKNNISQDYKRILFLACIFQTQSIQ